MELIGCHGRRAGSTERRSTRRKEARKGRTGPNVLEGAKGKIIIMVIEVNVERPMEVKREVKEAMIQE